MIVWLASYPRSGNTLTRMLLFKTMGLESDSDEYEPAEFDFQYHKAWNGMGSWDAFYQYASQSTEIFLVKTHRIPRDSQPAIYIVRDGRKSCLSYSYFHQRSTPAPCPSLLEIVIGKDFYGGWSEHFGNWACRDNVLTVRYEELVGASDELLNTIAKWVRYAGPIRPWINPFDEEKKKDPHFFREGKVEWQGDDHAWTPLVNAAFLKVHGDLMVELGYLSAESVAMAMQSGLTECLPLLTISRQLLTEKRVLEGICSARQSVIDELKTVCDERLSLVERLNSILKSYGRR